MNVYSTDPVPVAVPEEDYYLTPNTEWNYDDIDVIYEPIDKKVIREDYENTTPRDGYRPPLPPPNIIPRKAVSSDSDESVNQVYLSSPTISKPPAIVAHPRSTDLKTSTTPPDLPTSPKPKLFFNVPIPKSSPADPPPILSNSNVEHDASSPSAYVPMAFSSSNPPDTPTTPKPKLIFPTSSGTPQKAKSPNPDPNDATLAYVPMVGALPKPPDMPTSPRPPLILPTTIPISTTTGQRNHHAPAQPASPTNTSTTTSRPPHPQPSLTSQIYKEETPPIKSKSSSFVSYITPPLTPAQPPKPELFPKPALPGTLLTAPPELPPKNNPSSWTPTSPIIPVHVPPRPLSRQEVSNETTNPQGKGTSLGDLALETFSTVTNTTLGKGIISRVDKVVSVLKGSSSPNVLKKDARNSSQNEPVEPQLPPRPNPERMIQLGKPAVVPIGQKGWILDEPIYQFRPQPLLPIPDGAEDDEGIYESYHETNVQTTALCTHDGKPVKKPHIRLWKSLTVVQDKLSTERLSQTQIQLQESKFEIITTEASYINSMNLLQDHFIAPLLQDRRLPPREMKSLFQEVKHVHSSSLAFMEDLETCWKKSIFLKEIFDVVGKHAQHGFQVYVRYCSYQCFMAETYKKLVDGSPMFVKAMHELEQQPDCYQLPLHSFLLLPLQRVTRLLLLVEASLKLMTPQHVEFGACNVAALHLKQLVDDCNVGARVSSRRHERMARLERQLVYPPGVERILINVKTRWFVMSGDVTIYEWRSVATKTASVKYRKKTACLFLLSDLLIVSEKRNDTCYTVLKHCVRHLVRADDTRNQIDLPRELKQDQHKKYMMCVSLFDKQLNKYVDVVVSCILESDRDRWLEALAPQITSKLSSTPANEPDVADTKEAGFKELQPVLNNDLWKKPTNLRKNYGKPPVVSSQFEQDSLPGNVNELPGSQHANLNLLPNPLQENANNLPEENVNVQLRRRPVRDKTGPQPLPVQRSSSSILVEKSRDHVGDAGTRGPPLPAPRTSMYLDNAEDDPEYWNFVVPTEKGRTLDSTIKIESDVQDVRPPLPMKKRHTNLVNNHGASANTLDGIYEGATLDRLIAQNVIKTHGDKNAIHRSSRKPIPVKELQELLKAKSGESVFV